MGKKVTKKIYDVPIEATYLYETTNFDGTFNRWNTQVSVIGETEKCYLVKLKEPIRQHFVGDEIWVMKKKIILRLPKQPIDTSNYWFNNFESREINPPSSI